jgi:hypothetical protein
MTNLPAWSRDAALVLNSPYFTDPPRDLDGSALRVAFELLLAERDALGDEVRAVESYDELSPEAKLSWDRAWPAALAAAGRSEAAGEHAARTTSVGDDYALADQDPGVAVTVGVADGSRYGA